MKHSIYVVAAFHYLLSSALAALAFCLTIDPMAVISTMMIFACFFSLVFAFPGLLWNLGVFYILSKMNLKPLSAWAAVIIADIVGALLCVWILSLSFGDLLKDTLPIAIGSVLVAMLLLFNLFQSQFAFLYDSRFSDYEEFKISEYENE